MKIRTDAWHFKVFMWSNHVPADTEKKKDYPVSLCPYFWRVFLAIFWLPPVMLMCLLGKIWWIPYSVLGRRLSLLNNFDFQPLSLRSLHPFVSIDRGMFATLEGGVGVSILSTLVILIISGISGWMHHREESLIIGAIGVGTFLLIGLLYYFREKNYNVSKSNDSLLLAYLSAVKQRVCPRIEFVDKD